MTFTRVDQVPVEGPGSKELLITGKKVRRNVNRNCTDVEKKDCFKDEKHRTGCRSRQRRAC